MPASKQCEEARGLSCLELERASEAGKMEVALR